LLKELNMIKVQTNNYDSSTVKSSSYNYEHQILTVHFSYATYVYSDVNAIDYTKFATATSQGQALNTYIKGKYNFEKINAEEKTLNI
jgi:hypothetical protein